jgi:hypothetical protein
MFVFANKFEIVEIANQYMARIGHPIDVSIGQWKRARCEHGRLTSATFSTSGAIPLSAICIIHRQGEEGAEALWGVRYSVSTDDGPMGSNFFFPLGILTSLGIVHELKTILSYTAVSQEAILLVNQLRPTSVDVAEIGEWPDNTRVSSLDDEADRRFALAACPARSAYALRTEGSPRPPSALSNSMARETADKPSASGVDLSALPAEIAELVVCPLAAALARSTRATDGRALLALRAVSRRFRNLVDEACTTHVVDVRSRMERAHKTKRVDDIFEARDALLESKFHLDLLAAAARLHGVRALAHARGGAGALVARASGEPARGHKRARSATSPRPGARSPLLLKHQRAHWHRLEKMRAR